MKKSRERPDSPEVTARIIERIKQMTPEELIAFLEYRTPGVEETDMTGMFSDKPRNGQKPTTKRPTGKS